MPLRTSSKQVPHGMHRLCPSDHQPVSQATQFLQGTQPEVIRAN